MSDIFNTSSYKKYYSDDFIFSILDDLSINKNKFKEVEDILLLSASHYFFGLKQADLSPRPSDIEKKLKKFEKSCGNLIDSFNSLEDTELLNIMRAISKYKIVPENTEQNLILNNTFKKGAFLNTIEILKYSTSLALKEKPAKQTKKSKAIDAWYVIVIRLFELSERIKCELPHYYKGVGYISESIDILHKIIKLLDNDITKARIVKAMKDKTLL